MMKFNIQMDKKVMALIGTAALIVIVFLMFIGPLWSKVSKVSHKVKVLNDDLTVVRNALREGKGLNSSGRLISRGKISLAINEIMEAGGALDIDFIATSPQKIQIVEHSKYPVIPIQIELQSKYKNFGKFLGKLENLEQSIVTVRDFNIDRDAIILPDVKVDLTVDVHLKAGEGG